MAQKITQWLVVTLVLSLGFGQLLRLEYFGATIYLHDLFVGGILLANLASLHARGVWKYPGIACMLLGLLIGWVHAATQYSLAELVLPALYLLRLLSYLTLFLLVRHIKVTIPRPAFVVAGTITLLIGLAQYFFLPDMRLFQYLGWDDHLNRLTLPHFDPTYTGVMLVLFLFLLEQKERVWMAVTGIAIALTYARSVILAFAAAQIVVLRNVYIVVLVFAFAIYVTWIRPHGFGEGTNLLRTYSIESRLSRDLTVVQESGWRLLIGSGYNIYARGDRVSEKGYPNHAVGPNSSYISILATSGILGLYGWLLFLRHLYKQAKYKAAILFVAFASLFNNVLLYPFALLWILLVHTSDERKLKTTVPSVG